MRPAEVVGVIRGMGRASYWTRENTVEFAAFATKIAIIVPGLIFGRQWWWLYIVALLTSLALIWTSTVKTLPTIILFNVAWVLLAACGIAREFL